MAERHSMIFQSTAPALDADCTRSDIVDELTRLHFRGPDAQATLKLDKAVRDYIVAALLR